MLDLIRANAQSWGVKIAFGIIILVFVFWGVGGLTGGPSTVILTVNGEPITIQEFQRKYEQLEQQVRAQYPDLDAAGLKAMQLKQQLIQNLILENLIMQEAKRVGIVVTPVELRKLIESFPAFHNAEGKFDPDAYVRVIKAQRNTPGNFEAELRNNMLMNRGLSGCSNMGCDIGGFAGPAPEAELLLRWLQNGIFQPRFCLNSANNDNTVTQPWMYEENLPYIRAAYQLRYRLLPTLYSLMYESNQNGMPAWRPLFLEFPNDPKCYTDKNLTFMFGKSILVANVVEKGATTRTVYLPAGCTWYDMNDDLRAYEGGQTIEIPVTLASIPMFLRGSAVVVTTEDVKYILKDTMRQIDLLVAAETDTSFVLYDDDGHTEDYKNGVYAKTTITVKAGDRTDIRFATEGSYESPVERMTLKLVSKKKGALWASVDGQQLPQFIVRDGWEAAESGWYYNLPDRTIWVKFAKPAKKDFTVTVSTEKFDLIGMAED